MILAGICVISLVNATVASTVYFEDGDSYMINSGTYDAVRVDKESVNDPGTHLEIAGEAIIDFSVKAYNNSTVKISGGSIGTDFYAFQDCKAEITGGTISGLTIASWDSTIDIKGGIFTQGIMASGDATIFLHGSNFSVNGQALSMGESLFGYADFFGFGAKAEQGIIKGTLQNGTELNTMFNIDRMSPLGEVLTADIIVVPEPATLGLLTLGVFLLRKKSRS